MVELDFQYKISNFHSNLQISISRSFISCRHSEKFSAITNWKIRRSQIIKSSFSANPLENALRRRDEPFLMMMPFSFGSFFFGGGMKNVKRNVQSENRRRMEDLRWIFKSNSCWKSNQRENERKIEQKRNFITM